VTPNNISVNIKLNKSQNSSMKNVKVQTDNLSSHHKIINLNTVYCMLQVLNKLVENNMNNSLLALLTLMK
jgi:hypothetical protein